MKFAAAVVAMIVAGALVRSQFDAVVPALDCGTDAPSTVPGGVRVTPPGADRPRSVVATESSFAIEAGSSNDSEGTVPFSILAYGKATRDGIAIRVTQSGTTVQLGTRERGFVHTPAVVVVTPGVTTVQLRTPRGEHGRLAVRSLGSRYLGGQPRWTGAIVGRRLDLRCARVQ